MNSAPKKLVVAISGGGRTLKNLLDYNTDLYEIVGVVANKECSGLEFARSAELPYRIKNFRSTSIAVELKNWLVELDADFVALAGFLQKWPTELLQKYPTVNIHPALLPKFGGHGMYGMNVHRAVKAANEATSGATVHVVSEEYDEGPLIAQAAVSLTEQDTAEDIASKVFAVECLLYPKAIEKFIRNNLQQS